MTHQSSEIQLIFKSRNILLDLLSEQGMMLINILGQVLMR